MSGRKTGCLDRTLSNASNSNIFGPPPAAFCKVGAPMTKQTAGEMKMRIGWHVANMNIPYYFFRTLPDGRRQVSWRVWLLIFVAPVLFLAFAAFFTINSLLIVTNYQRTMGEVVRVYEAPGYTPWDGETTDYSPVFRYEFKPGQTTDASTGQSSPNWNFAIGSKHAILFDPAQKRNVKLDNVEQLWALPAIIGAIGGAVLIPALIAAAFIRRWQRNAELR